MTKSFKCPSCGAPLDYDGGEKLTVQCPFCSNVVIVPEELRPAKPAPAAAVPAEPVPADPETIRERIKQNRRAAREQRRELRHQLRKSRHQGG